MTRTRDVLRVLALASTAAVALIGGAAPARADDHVGFVGTWEAAPQPIDQPTPGPGAVAAFGDQTERAIVHTSIGGDAVRVRLSNIYGGSALALDDVQVAVRATGADIVPGTSRRLTFAGRQSVSIPIGQEVLSDPAPFRARPEQDLAVSLHIQFAEAPFTAHSLTLDTSYLMSPITGDHAGDVSGAAFASGAGFPWTFVDGIDVVAPHDTSSVIAFGDSITEGFRSTPDTNRRYTDVLARRLLAAHQHESVLNAGISGNRILLDSPSFGVKALDRLDRDVLDQPNARDVIVLLGINDIGQLPHQFDPNQIIAGLEQIIARSHARGLRVIGGTLLPFENTTIPNYFTPQGETTREAVNAWIRTSHAFDAVIDFDRVMGSPADPLMLNPAFDSGDHLHPNYRGYQAMGDAVDLRLLRGPQTG